MVSEASSPGARNNVESLLDNVKSTFFEAANERVVVSGTTRTSVSVAASVVDASPRNPRMRAEEIIKAPGEIHWCAGVRTADS